MPPLPGPAKIFKYTKNSGTNVSTVKNYNNSHKTSFICLKGIKQISTLGHILKMNLIGIILVPNFNTSL